MSTVNHVLLILHLLGLAAGFSVTFANIVMRGVMAKATPQENATLLRFLPAMSRVGHIGLGVLWITGLSMVFTRFGGFAALPWTFHVKLTAVVLLTIAMGFNSGLERRARRGETALYGRIGTVGKISATLALIAVIFAVLTFD